MIIFWVKPSIAIFVSVSVVSVAIAMAAVIAFT